MLVTPLPAREHILLGDSPAAVIFISDPEKEVQQLDRLLAHYYHLTPAESKLAVLLSNGTSLKRAAGQLGVAKETARSQLKSVFAKTDTHSQSELLRLFLTSTIGLGTLSEPGQEGGALREARSVTEDGSPLLEVVDGRRN